MIVCTAQGSDEFAQMRRINWAFASRLCDKYENLMCWPIFIIVSMLHNRKSGTYSFGLICVCTRINVRKIIVPRSQKKINRNTQTTWFVRHAAQSQPTPYLRPLSVRQQNTVGMAFRLRADSDQILHAYLGDGNKPMLLGPLNDLKR